MIHEDAVLGVSCSESIADGTARSRSRGHVSKASGLLGSRLLLFCAVLGVLAVVLPTAGACARTLSPEPSGGGLVENPDHTWTLYAYGHVIKVYSSAEKETIDRVWHGEEFDLIPFRASGHEVTGISEAEAVAAEGLLNRLRTGKPYATAGEREVGEGYMRTVEKTESSVSEPRRCLAASSNRPFLRADPMRSPSRLVVALNECSRCLYGAPKG